MNFVLRLIRWVLVLPASIGTGLIVYATAKICDNILSVLANFFFGPDDDVVGTIFCGFIAGGTYVMAGVATAPAGKRAVAMLLASLPTLVSIAAIALSVINLFHHFGTSHPLTFLRNTSIACGAGTVSFELSRKKKLLQTSRYITTLSQDEIDHQSGSIDYDATLNGLYDEDEPAL